MTESTDAPAEAQEQLPSDPISLRERGYASSLEAQIAAATRGGLAAYIESQIRYLDFIELLEQSENPNLRFNYMFLVGSKRLGVTMECPKVVALAPKTFDVKREVLKGSFFITSNEKSSIKTETNIETGIEGHSPFVSGHMNATVGVSSDQQRETDQRSSFDYELEMGIGSMPEGVSRILDIYLKSFDRMATAITDKLVEKVLELAEEADAEFVQVEEVQVTDAEGDDAAE